MNLNCSNWVVFGVRCGMSKGRRCCSMFFWINVLIDMYQLEETRFGPWEMTWVRDISEGSHNEND